MTADPADLIGDLLRQADSSRMLAAAGELCCFDRYQASAGIDEAAAFVAARAAAAGLADVQVSRYRADGQPQWWSFEAPRSWTPVRARIELPLPGGGSVLIDHADSPYALATYSAATPAGGLLAPLRSWPAAAAASSGGAEGSSGGAAGFGAGSSRDDRALAGAVLVLTAADYARPGVLAAVEACGAAGFVTSGPARGTGRELRGRIELPPRTPLFAFSLTAAEFEQLLPQADTGVRVQVDIRLGPVTTMPVVTASLPGEVPGPSIWLTAHLCHPRPSANDNAAGVAAVLEVAEQLVRRRRAGSAGPARREIRFAWGPEFLGSAALIHDRLRPPGVGQSNAGQPNAGQPNAGQPTTGPLPAAVLNLDMVGEDQSACASPFVVEHSPDTIVSLLNPVADYIVGEVFAQTSSAPGSWQSTPFRGFSDHALFVDPAVGCPGIEFNHPADRFNHSAGDVLANVSPVELTRSVAATAALAEILAAANPLPPAQLQSIVAAWCARELAEARQVADRHAVRDYGAWSTRYLASVRAQHAALTSRRTILPADEPLAGQPPAATQFSAPSRSSSASTASTASAATDSGATRDRGIGGDPPDASGVPARDWSGPLNLRAMLASTSVSARSAVSALASEDKLNLSLFVNASLRIDGTRTWDEIIAVTSFALQRPIVPATANLLRQVFHESGWAR